jgi:hypothetical protein
MQSLDGQNLAKNGQNPGQKVVIELSFTWHSINANFLRTETGQFLPKITPKSRHSLVIPE